MSRPELRSRMHQIHILLTLFCSKINVLAVQGSSDCSESRSQRGVALLHAAYSSKVIHRFFHCVNECINDPPCMSINFWWDTRKCDLNYKTKEHSCRACLVAQPHSTYMGMVKPPGNQGKPFNSIFKLLLFEINLERQFKVRKSLFLGILFSI